MIAGRSGSEEVPSRPWFAAHELFTCLNAVRGASELLLAGAAGPLSGEGLGAVATIAEAARELERHIRHCQAIDRLREAPSPRRRPIALADLLPAKATASVPEVPVLVAPEEARAAFALLCPPRAGQPLQVCERHRTVRIALSDALPEPGTGRGRILLELAGLQLRRSGGRLLPREHARLLVLLPKAPSSPEPEASDGKSGGAP